MDISKFDDIRCYTDEELPGVMERLLSEKPFVKLLSTIYPLLPKDVIRQRLLSCQSIAQFQRDIVFPFLQYLESTETTGVDFVGVDLIDESSSYLYISNHRDIIIDPAFLGTKFIERDMETMEIAIGDNLLVYPWIEDLVRINRAFVVKRSEEGRKALESAQTLSDYISYTLSPEKNKSVWIAQREGRAKDGNDRTQKALLKMLNMSGDDDFIDSMIRLNICPLSISYEYDPCDYLKAKEFQQRRDNPDFKKSMDDDLLSMQVGVLGYKGKVVFELTGLISDKLETIGTEITNKNEQVAAVAELIDNCIFEHYTIFKTNKIAYDLFLDTKKFLSDYTPAEKISFEAYLHKQLDKIELPGKDEDFLKTKLLEMYANPLINKLRIE